MEKNEFELLMTAITGLKTEMKADIAGLEAKMNARFDAVDKRFDKIESKLDATFDKVGDHEVRIKDLEGPSA